MKLGFLTVLMISLFLSQKLDGQRWNLSTKNTIDLIVGADYSYRTIGGDPRIAGVRQSISHRSRQEKPKSNYRFGFNYSYYLTDRFYLKSGVRLSNPGFKTGPVNSYNPTLDINSFDKQLLLAGERLEFNYILIEIPYVMRYVYSLNWCRSYLEAGFSSNIYLHTQIKTKTIGQELLSHRKHEQIRKHNLLVNLSIGGEMVLSRDMSWFVQIIGRYQLDNLRQSDLIEKIGSLGVESGVRFEF